MINEIKIFSPATVANVSCAFDVMGFAIEAAGDTMYFKKIKEKGIKIKITGNINLPKAPEKNVAGVVALKMIKDIKPSFGILIEIEKGIKPGSGMGSSGASAAGAAFGVNMLLGKPFDKYKLVEFAMEGEALASGTAHPDNVTPAIFGGFTLIRSINPTDIIPLNIPEKLVASVIHPDIEIKTQNARNVLKKSILLKDAVIQWGNIAGLVSGLYREDYDLIARSMNDAIIEPVRSMLIPLFDKTKKAALDSGALGCSISGSGPSIFALSKGFETAQKVSEAMVKIYESTDIFVDVYTSKINKEGIKILSIS
jgi:homoserine kinase